MFIMTVGGDYPQARCAKCEKTDLRFKAEADWDRIKQHFVLSRVHHIPFCNSCGEDTRLLIS